MRGHLLPRLLADDQDVAGVSFWFLVYRTLPRNPEPELLVGNPEMPLHIDAAIVLKGDAFAAKALFHGIGGFETQAAG